MIALGVGIILIIGLVSGLLVSLLIRSYNNKNNQKNKNPLIIFPIVSGIVMAVLATVSEPCFHRLQVESVLQEIDIPVFKYIKEYDLEIYNGIIDEFLKREKDFGNDAAVEQFKQVLGTILIKLYIPYASDKAIVSFYNGNLAVLRFLLEKNALLCAQSIFPQVYGLKNNIELYTNISSEMKKVLGDGFKEIIKTGAFQRDYPESYFGAEMLLSKLIQDFNKDFPDKAAIIDKVSYSSDLAAISSQCDAYLDMIEYIREKSGPDFPGIARYLLLNP